MRKLSLLLLTTALSAATPQVGQPAPDFTLPSQDGSKISLHDFRGKWVVLYFYPKDGTPGCTVEAHNFQRDIAKYEQAGAVIVGVSVDSADSHKEFCAKQGLSFKLRPTRIKTSPASMIRSTAYCACRRATRFWWTHKVKSPRFGQASAPASTARKCSPRSRR